MPRTKTEKAQKPCNPGKVKNAKGICVKDRNPAAAPASVRVLSATKTAKQSPVISVTRNGKKAGTLKKYQDRPSPPYPANENCGKVLQGNDGNMYESRANKKGICSWKKL
uniref:Uncharacterized protein n=1 Tax=viral metagenome TaxID=1070528 RepID=A0A6C0I3I7_9ZZZZ